jgi:thioesterase domain-containing protein
MMTTTTEFEHRLFCDIPLTRAMQLSLRSHSDDELVLAAPLAPNVNDKGCAFGGSLGSLLTLAGWSLIVMHLRKLGADCEVYVQDSHMRYLAPVWSDFAAHARLAESETWSAFTNTLATRGRARMRVRCRVPLAEGGDACTLNARFVAIAKS